jgi:hypothetical protein
MSLAQVLRAWWRRYALLTKAALSCCMKQRLWPAGAVARYQMGQITAPMR